jgi:hypothetical protein
VVELHLARGDVRGTRLLGGRAEDDVHVLERAPLGSGTMLEECASVHKNSRKKARKGHSQQERRHRADVM